MPTNWDTVDVLKGTMDVTWQFDYSIGVEKLKNLYSKSKKMQWNAEEDIDWSKPIDPANPLIDEGRFLFERYPFMQKLSKSKRELFRAHMTAQFLSQIMHGEQGALMTSAALTHAVPNYEGKLYAAQQTADEARHVEVFEMYIRRLAIVYPMSPGLKKLIDVTLQADHWVKIAIGMNMVVESMALGAFHNMRNATSCETLRKIMELVLRDESRHVAFGNVYVGEAISEMHPDDREDIADFVFDVVASRRQNVEGQRVDAGFAKVLENVGIDPQDFLKGMIEARAQGLRPEAQPGQVHTFNDLMMPALVRVGAITPRTEQRMKEAGIEINSDPTVLESMEDAETGTIEFGQAN